MIDFGFPGGKRFAFSVVDDTDVSTVDNVRPLYEHLYQLGMRTTKTVWPLAYPGEASAFEHSETLEDADYLAFVQELNTRGFEITWHGAAMESSTRARSKEALERFRDLIGYYPRVHCNHAYNRENLYWGADRVDNRLLRWAYGRLNGRPMDFYQGTTEGSPYWWGDLCRNHFEYGRNLTFDSLNLAKINPSMPYRDPRRDLINRWFSACDADDVHAFNHRLRTEAQAKLEDEGGFSIVATHFGKGFVRNGDVDPETRRLLDELAQRDGWFPTVSELLDHLRSRQVSDDLPAAEWKRMQWSWAWDLVQRRLRTKR